MTEIAARDNIHFKGEATPWIRQVGAWVKVLLIALWTDPDVAMGLILIMAGVVGMVLTHQATWQAALGHALIELAGGTVLWKAKGPSLPPKAGPGEKQG